MNNPEISKRERPDQSIRVQGWFPSGLLKKSLLPTGDHNFSRHIQQEIKRTRSCPLTAYVHKTTRHNAHTDAFQPSPAGFSSRRSS